MMRLDRFRMLRWLVLAPVLAAAGCLMLADDPAGWSCASDADCHSDERCVQPGGFDHKVCAVPSACGPKNTCLDGSPCNGGVCTVQPCEAGDTTCGAFLCDQATRTCRRSCLAGTDCADGFFCDFAQCVPRECSSLFDPVCNGFQCVNGRCLTSCSSNVQCADGQRCSHSECVPATCSDGSAAGACNVVIDPAGGSSGTGGSGGKSGAGGSSGSSGHAGSGGAAPVCDPVKQTGCKKGQKCTLRAYSSPVYVLTCVADGDADEDTHCVTGNGSSSENCVAGTFCTSYGSFGDSFNNLQICKPLCRVDSDCAKGNFCATAFPEAEVGLCVPTCTPFEPCAGHAYSTCSAPYRVNQTDELRLSCRHLGSSKMGTVCSASFTCAEGLTCRDDVQGSGSSCQPICDDAHPCPAAKSSCEFDGKVCSAGQTCLCE